MVINHVSKSWDPILQVGNPDIIQHPRWNIQVSKQLVTPTYVSPGIPSSKQGLPSLKLTFSHLKIDGWKIHFLLGRHIFRCELLVSGRVFKLLLSLKAGNLWNPCFSWPKTRTASAGNPKSCEQWEISPWLFALNIGEIIRNYPTRWAVTSYKWSYLYIYIYIHIYIYRAIYITSISRVKIHPSETHLFPMYVFWVSLLR